MTIICQKKGKSEAKLFFVARVFRKQKTMFSLFLQQTQSAPYILFDKHLITSDFFSIKVDTPVDVYYTIANLGDSAATDLSIVDHGIPRDQFEVSEDAAPLTWKYLGAGKNITHVFQVKALQPGSLHMSPSQLIYFDGAEKNKAISSSVFWFEATGSRSIGARTNFKGYLIFLVAAAAAVVAPLLLWLPTRKDAAKVKTN